MFHVLTGHTGYLRCVNWSADSKKVVTAALDNLVRVFDVETGTLICEPLSGHKSTLTSVAFRSFLNGDEPEVLSGAFSLSPFLSQTLIFSYSQLRRNGPGLGTEGKKLQKDSDIQKLSHRLGQFSPHTAGDELSLV